MEFNVPMRIQEAFLNFLTDREKAGDAFWHIDRWSMLYWESALDTLFIRCADPAWSRKNSEEENVINDFMRAKLGSRYQTAYLKPLPNKENREKVVVHKKR